MRREQGGISWFRGRTRPPNARPWRRVWNRADSSSQDSMSWIDALRAHEAPVHFLSDASAAHSRSHTGRSSRVWDCTIQLILYDHSRIVLSRRRRRGIIRDPKGLFPRRLCPDQVGTQTANLSSSPRLQTEHLFALVTTQKRWSPLSTRSFFTHLTVTSPASRSRVWTAFS